MTNGEKQGTVPREFFEKCGDLGYLCVWMEEKYGGAGGDLLHTVIQTEELCERGLNGIYTRLHSDVIAPYIHRKGSDAQKEKWLPEFAKGNKILALALSEPEAGSDLASLQTKAVKDGDSYVINGNKAFISNGMLADVVVVAARTDFQAKPHKGISLFMVETDTPGFSRKRIPKIGLNAQEHLLGILWTARIPAGERIGEENKGFLLCHGKIASRSDWCSHQCLAQANIRGTDNPVRKQRKMFGTTLECLSEHTVCLGKIGHGNRNGAKLRGSVDFATYAEQSAGQRSQHGKVLLLRTGIGSCRQMRPNVRRVRSLSGISGFPAIRGCPVPQAIGGSFRSATADRGQRAGAIRRKSQIYRQQEISAHENKSNPFAHWFPCCF